MTTRPMDESRRRQVHGKVQPLRPSLWGRIRANRAAEAAVSRAMGEQPQPPLWAGVALLSALSLIAGIWLIAVVSIVAPAGNTSTSPTSLHSLGTGAAEATGDRP